MVIQPSADLYEVSIEFPRLILVTALLSVYVQLLYHMWLRSYSCCISLLLLIASAHTEDQLQELCEIHLSVSKEASVAVEEWRQQYAQYVKNERNFTETLYLRFYSLQEALSALNTTDFPSTNSCVQLVIPNGTHTVTSKVVIAQNLKMLANDSYDDVIVKFNVSTQENVSTFNVITFKNADYVVLKGIKFIGSPGIIAMESIAYIHVSHCHFRSAVDVYTSDYLSSTDIITLVYVC